MSGHHAPSVTGGRARIWLAGLAVALAAVLLAAFAGPAGASSQTVKAQLSLSGLASADNPLGGSVIGVRPGDKVTFSAAGLPSAGLDKLGLGDLLGGLLNAGATFQVTADFSALPGGAKNTVLSGTKTKTFTFSGKGSFSFTWTAQRVTLLGVIPINLDGNQLAQAGVKLNAGNDYVGKVVVADNPPQGGLSVQLPSVSVAPSAPVVGQLPTLTIPGVSLPTVGVSVPNLNPVTGGGSKSSSPAPAKGPSGAPSSAGVTYQPPALSIPQQVVPGGGGGDVNGGSNGGGGFRLGVAGSGSNGQFAVSSGSATGKGAGSAGGGSGDAAANGATGGSKTVDLASSSSSPSGQLPVLLAILAVITLAVVGGIYARLYLLGRKAPSSAG